MAIAFEFAGANDTRRSLRQLDVTPPALRAIGSEPISTHAVSLPSMTRCRRSQVV